MPTALLAPRHWPLWLLVCTTWLAVRTPLRVQFALGRGVGALLHAFARERRHIAETNVRLCFPDLDAAGRAVLVRRTFASVGLGVLDTARAWFRDPARYRDRVDVDGIEHLEAAAQSGRGVLLVGAHFTTLDFAGALLSLFADIDVVYRRNRNPVVEWLMRRGRERLYGAVVERKDTRTLLRRLDAGRTLWYAADQDYGRKVSVFAPFFGVDAATISVTSRLARRQGAAVLFFSHFRDERAGRFSLRLSPPLDGYPSGDDVADATRLNAVIEREIRRDPAQYLWLHRRFKTRPPGVVRPY
jgi:KDO2-lipid IV(A) lauroyltransferase